MLIKSTVRNSAVMLDNHVGEVNKCPLNGVVDVHYSDYLSILNKMHLPVVHWRKLSHNMS